MEIKYNNGNISVTGVTSFNLKQTLDCGQCFRWEETEPDTFIGVAFEKTLTVSQQEDTVLFYDCTMEDFENIWFDYFDLGRDYNRIRQELSQMHPVLKEAGEYAPGIRILKQDPWEALCSFIISQNNNIPRIKGIITRLCESFGRELKNGVYGFPSAEEVSRHTVEDLAVLRSGFRAKYILDAAQKVASNEIDLDIVKIMPTAQARAELMKIKGVGPKVADCTMLYGMGKTDCFPLDVWMKRAMQVLFSDITYESFGENAGIAQQYIFHYSRMHPEMFNTDD